MRFIADLHIHSKFSRATSRDMTFDNIAYWAKIKGISLVASGDFTHPEWFFLTKEKLEPAGNGFFRLKSVLPPANDYLKNCPASGPTTSISSSRPRSASSTPRRERSGRSTSSSWPPTSSPWRRSTRRLSGLGNLRSDGRPILGLDARQFVKIVADACPRCVVIPSHIWTPWFSLFGANSGFDAIEECFEEMTPVHLRPGDGIVLRPADELAALRPRQVRARLQLRRPLPVPPRPGGQRL